MNKIDQATRIGPALARPRVARRDVCLGAKVCGLRVEEGYGGGIVKLWNVVWGGGTAGSD